MTDQIRRRQISGVCEACGKWAPELDRDHVVPLSWGGAHDLSNIQHICKPCHKKKTAAERHQGPPPPPKSHKGCLWVVLVLLLIAVLAV